MDAPPPPRRLASLDALRGFDMLWIVGGAGVVRSWTEAADSGALQAIAHQLEHAEWHGYRAWDLIFPLFLFLAGVSWPFSLARRRERGDGGLLLHVLRRGLVLVLLGAIYNGLLRFDLEAQRWPSVLGRIGLGWAGAAALALRWSGRALWVWAFGILLVYWALLAWFPVPGFGAGDLRPGHSVVSWVDRGLLPGVLHRGNRDPEGLLSTLPAIATGLFGVLAGEWLRREEPSGSRKSAGLAIAGLAALAAGGLWHQLLPINKNLWTSSFVLWTAGQSCLLLAVFHELCDVRGWRSWSLPLAVVGSNAIAAYLLHRFVDFQGVAELLFARGAERVSPVLMSASGLLLEWALLWQLFRRRIFLRV